MNRTKENGKEIDDAERDAKRLRDYLPGLEQITRMIENEIASGNMEVDSLLKNMLPFLCKVFNSEFSFVADEKGSIILSNPTNHNLLQKTIHDSVEAIPPISEGEPLVLTKNFDSFPELKELDVNSILIFKSQIQDKWRWIGICNGKNEPEPYIGGDKKFLKELIRLFTIGIKYNFQKEVIRRKTEIETEYKIFSERFRESQNKGDWNVIWQAAEDFIYVHPEFNNNFKLPVNKQILNECIDNKKFNGDEVSSNFLDACLCDFILKFSSNQSSETQPGKSDIREIFKPDAVNKTFYINLPQRKVKIEDIPLEKYKLAALAGARILLVRLHFLGVQKEKSTLSKSFSDEEEISHTGINSGKDDESLWDSIKCIFKLTEPEIDIHLEQYDSFNRLVDWLRTQWLYIYYLSWNTSVEPVPKDVEKMREIYVEVLEKTVELIQTYLSSVSIEKNDKREKEKSTEDDVIKVDSDWLLAFLAQNVLLSSSLNHYYGLNPVRNEGSITGNEERRNPLTMVRYLLYLSHFVLYILHCARFARRRTRFLEEDTKSESEEFFLRPPLCRCTTNS